MEAKEGGGGESENFSIKNEGKNLQNIQFKLF